jgi:hypothetical protein
MSVVIENEFGDWSKAVDKSLNETVSLKVKELESDVATKVNNTYAEDKLEQSKYLPELAEDEQEELSKGQLKEQADDSLEKDYDDEFPDERTGDEEDREYDEELINVYVKKLKTSNQKSKHGRNYDRVFACIYCHKLKTNIQTHLSSRHAHKPEVKEIMTLKEKKKSTPEINARRELEKVITAKQALLPNRGNNLHTDQVGDSMMDSS